MSRRDQYLLCGGYLAGLCFAALTDGDWLQVVVQAALCTYVLRGALAPKLRADGSPDCGR